MNASKVNYDLLNLCCYRCSKLSNVSIFILNLLFMSKVAVSLTLSQQWKWYYEVTNILV